MYICVLVSFCPEGPGDGTQVVRLSSKCLYLLSHFSLPSSILLLGTGLGALSMLNECSATKLYSQPDFILYILKHFCIPVYSPLILSIIFKILI